MIPLVSVVITTKNEEKHIGQCLASIRAQTYPQASIEVIVVDNASSDATQEIARRFTPHVFDRGPERSAQRNFGMGEKAQGAYVMYLDADMTLSPQVIERCVEQLEGNAEQVALYISEIVTGVSFWSKVRRFERTFYDATVIDCARFMRTDTFVRSGGFDTSMTGPEDWDLDKRLRAVGVVGLVREPIYHNEAEFHLRQYLDKKSYYAKSFDTYREKWGADDPDVRKQLGFWYRFFGVFTEEGKWVRLFVHPLLTMGMYALRFFVGVKFITR